MFDPEERKRLLQREDRREQLYKDLAAFLEKQYATGKSHTEAQELLTRLREFMDD